MEERLEYTLGDCQKTASRRSLRSSDAVAVFATLDAVPDLLGAWITHCGAAKAGPLEHDPRFDLPRIFVSILSGRLTPYYWRDTFDSADRLTRTYYGWRQDATPNPQGRELVPIGSNSVEALIHAPNVFHRLPAAYARLQELSAVYNFDWILSPLWNAYGTFLEDRLAFACVSLERFATAHNDYAKTQQAAGAAKTTVITPGQMTAVQRRLVPVLKEVGKELGVTDDDLAFLERKLANIHQFPNADKLTRVFTDLGIPITASVEETIKNRN